MTFSSECGKPYGMNEPSGFRLDDTAPVDIGNGYDPAATADTASPDAPPMTGYRLGIDSSSIDFASQYPAQGLAYPMLTTYNVYSNPRPIEQGDSPNDDKNETGDNGNADHTVDVPAAHTPQEVPTNADTDTDGTTIGGGADVPPPPPPHGVPTPAEDGPALPPGVIHRDLRLIRIGDDRPPLYEVDRFDVSRFEPDLTPPTSAELMEMVNEFDAALRTVQTQYRGYAIERISANPESTAPVPKETFLERRDVEGGSAVFRLDEDGLTVMYMPPNANPKNCMMRHYYYDPSALSFRRFDHTDTLSVLADKPVDGVDDPQRQARSREFAANTAFERELGLNDTPVSFAEVRHVLSRLTEVEPPRFGTYTLLSRVSQKVRDNPRAAEKLWPYNRTEANSVMQGIDDLVAEYLSRCPSFDPLRSGAQIVETQILQELPLQPDDNGPSDSHATESPYAHITIQLGRDEENQNFVNIEAVHPLSPEEARKVTGRPDIPAVDAEIHLTGGVILEIDSDDPTIKGYTFSYGADTYARPSELDREKVNAPKEVIGQSKILTSPLDPVDLLALRRYLEAPRI